MSGILQKMITRQNLDAGFKSGDAGSACGGAIEGDGMGMGEEREEEWEMGKERGSKWGREGERG